MNSAEIRFAVSEIFARERKQVRSAGNGVVMGEVRKTITVSLSRLMNSACASQIRPRLDSPSLRNARTDGHTGRQTDRQTDRQIPDVELLEARKGKICFYFFLLMSETFSERENCPVRSCLFEGSLQRVLNHIRQSHNSDDLPHCFVTRLGLQRCQFCQKWFAKLTQHLVQCKVCSKSSKERPTVVSQSVSVSSPTPDVDVAVATDANDIKLGLISSTCTSLESAAWQYV